MAEARREECRPQIYITTAFFAKRRLFGASQRERVT